MYLSKLEIFGFKSFAQKTTLTLSGGITAIVGPNGCGKTNIVDAIRWSLGEQRYSTLRSDKMEDVIFNGTKVRRPLNLAEVSLTIENNKGILPLEYNEVTITRRVFRNGESDYLMNRAVCRLKDIVSLFMDTGMGSNAYSVIELKMVETILSDKVEERRRLFEEAAGVTKYKARRKETIRRLGEVQADVIRLDDIITEVQKAVNSLHRQAKKSERYHELIERLHHLEVDVLQRDYTSLTQRLRPLEEKLVSSLSEEQSYHEKVQEGEALLDVLRQEEHDMERQYLGARKKLETVQESVRVKEHQLSLNHERQLSLRAQLERSDTTIATLRENHRQQLEAESELQREIETLGVELRATQSRREARKEDLSDAEAVLNEARVEAEARRTRRMGLFQELAKQENEVSNYRSSLERIENRLDFLTREDEGSSEQLSALRAQLEEVGRGQDDLAGSVSKAERRFLEEETQKRHLKDEIDALQNTAFDLQGRIGERMTKIDFLTGLVDRLEGYSESVQHLLRTKDWAQGSPATVADAISTDEKYRIAIESALGESAHYLIVDHLHEAINGLQRLRDQKKGKATFVCLSRVPKRKAPPPPITGDGIYGWATAVAASRPEHEDLFHMLLKSHLIVRDAEVAHTCLKEYPNLRCVTIEGDIYTSNGLVRGGSHSQDEGSFIGKKDQIAQLREEARDLQESLSRNQALLEEKNAAYAAIDLKRLAEDIKQSQFTLTAHEKKISQLSFEIEKHERTLSRNEQERTSLLSEKDLLEKRCATIQPRIDTLKAELETIEQDVIRHNEELAVLESRFAERNEAYNAAQVETVQQEGALQNTKNELARVQTLIQSILRDISSSEEETELATGDLDTLSSENLRMEEELVGLRESMRELVEDVSFRETALAEKKEKSETLEKSLHDNRQKHTQILALRHEIELKVAELRQRLETLVQRALEEYELTLAERVEEDDVFDLAAAKEEINDLKVKIKGLGPVNPLAFEEWKKEKERLDLLLTQRQDLVDAEKTLTDTIEEINRTAQQKFVETFQLIRQNFIGIFKSLFEAGDEADLILEDAADPLEAGIDIVAKPRGKRPHSIEMLSGGEKTLTAIALLFAIYLVKPSPFCILDEVDAPLDDANIDRFIRIIRQFSKNTQFIIVTHNKRTMEAADTLYGVTMEEEGISRIVSVRFDDPALGAFTQN